MVARKSPGLVLSVSLACLISSSVSAGPAIRIVHPANGTILPTHSDAEVLAELAPEFQDPSNFSSIAFEVIKTDGMSRFSLGKGDMRSRKLEDHAKAIWRNRTVPSGDYINGVFGGICGSERPRV
jgi:hypothetical protein